MSILLVEYYSGGDEIRASVPAISRLWTSGKSLAQARGRLVEVLGREGVKYSVLEERFVNVDDL
jgi:hypothetical protein